MVAVGDAENDHAFLAICECAVAVANALPALKKHADLVTDGDHGEGVAELVGLLEQNDLAGVKLERHEILLGNRENGEGVPVAPYGANLLLTGPSGGGKSTIATSFMERLEERSTNTASSIRKEIIQTFEGAVSLGDSEHPPSTAEVIRLLERAEDNCAVNLLAIRPKTAHPSSKRCCTRFWTSVPARDGLTGSSSTSRIIFFPPHGRLRHLPCRKTCRDWS